MTLSRDGAYSESSSEQFNAYTDYGKLMESYDANGDLEMWVRAQAVGVADPRMAPIVTTLPMMSALTRPLLPMVPTPTRAGPTPVTGGSAPQLGDTLPLLEVTADVATLVHAGVERQRLEPVAAQELAAGGQLGHQVEHGVGQARIDQLVERARQRVVVGRFRQADVRQPLR